MVRKRAKKRRSRAVTGSIVIRIIGDAGAEPDKCHLKKAHRVRWVNPAKTGLNFKIKFDVNPPPLCNERGRAWANNRELVVKKGTSSPWYRLRTAVAKGTRATYRVARTSDQPGPAPGPEIIADD